MQQITKESINSEILRKCLLRESGNLKRSISTNLYKELTMFLRAKNNLFKIR